MGAGYRNFRRLCKGLPDGVFSQDADGTVAFHRLDPVVYGNTIEEVARNSRTYQLAADPGPIERGTPQPPRDSAEGCLPRLRRRSTLST